MKRTGLILLLLMILLCIPVQAEEYMEEVFVYDLAAEEKEAETELLAMNNEEKEAVSFIIKCIGNRQKTIGLTRYGINWIDGVSGGTRPLLCPGHLFVLLQL